MRCQKPHHAVTVLQNSSLAPDWRERQLIPARMPENEAAVRRKQAGQRSIIEKFLCEGGRSMSHVLLPVRRVSEHQIENFARGRELMRGRKGILHTHTKWSRGQARRRVIVPDEPRVPA